MHRTPRNNRQRQTGGWSFSLGALIAAALILGPTTAARAAPGDKLIGKWKAKSMERGGRKFPVKAPREILFEYQAGGKFINIMKDGSNKVRTVGTWKATATTVTMKIKRTSSTATYKISGNKLRLKTKFGGQTTIFRMVKVP